MTAHARAARWLRSLLRLGVTAEALHEPGSDEGRTGVKAQAARLESGLWRNDSAARSREWLGRMSKNPIQFIEEVRQEVSKVTWPAWKEVWITTLMVLLMLALASIFFLVADQIIGWIVKTVLGLGL